jgi:hypothetical protein
MVLSDKRWGEVVAPLVEKTTTNHEIEGLNPAAKSEKRSSLLCQRDEEKVL